jgi:hypothetical protein
MPASGPDAAPKAAAGPVVLYITGSGRSGSTLIERTLGAAPGFANVGELIELFRRTVKLDERCGCGEQFSNCPFWTEVGRQAFGGWDSAIVAKTGELHGRVARQRRLPSLLLSDRMPEQFRQDLRDYRSAFARIYSAVAQVSGAGVIVDASKWPTQALCLSTDPGTDLRILHLVRDARGVAHSWQKPDVARPQTNGVDKLVMATHASAQTAARWLAFQSEATLVGRLIGNATRIRYEDFVTAPRQTLETSLRDIGVDPQPDWFAHVNGDRVHLPASHGLSGNPSRFQVGAIKVRHDEAWRTQMATRDKALVTAITLLPLSTYGYLAKPVARLPAAAAASTDSLLPASWPAVSVVLPTRGRPELVRRSLRAVVAQTYPGELECIVVHDQELTDPSLTELGRPGREIQVVSNIHKPGLAGARNSGLEHASGVVVASCDDDDVWFPHKLQVQVQRLLDEPDLLVVGSGIRLIMPRSRIVEWPGRADRISREVLLRNRVKELHSSTLVMWRDAFAKAGWYDEDLPFGYGEDYDWILRASRVGRIGVVREPLADISKDVQSWFRERSANTATALEVLLEKHPEITTSHRGHARVLGQIAFARASLGDRRSALKLAGRALFRWPLSPHAWLAVGQSGLGLDPQAVLGAARKIGRGLS